MNDIVDTVSQRYCLLHQSMFFNQMNIFKRNLFQDIQT